MRERIHKHLTTIVVSMVTAMISAGGMAVAGQIINADKLNGYSANQLIRATSSQRFVNSDPASSVSGNLLTAKAPKRGGLLLNVDFSCASFHGAAYTRWDVTLKIDGGSAGDLVIEIPKTGAESGASGAFTGYVPVAAGSHTVSYSAGQSLGDASLDCNIFTSSLFVPFNNRGEVPALTRLEPQIGRVGSNG
jgi:hypothetical protein